MNIYLKTVRFFIVLVLVGSLTGLAHAADEVRIETTRVAESFT